LAVGPCVCQMSLDRWCEPCEKDMVILYGADIYLDHYRDYREIDAEEGKRLLQKFRQSGLVHIVDFCMSSGKWTFVVCNCEPEICLLTRAFLATGEFILPGPEVVVQNSDLCIGVDSCGVCIERCIFGANIVACGKAVVQPDKCLGCGLCVCSCPASARVMALRKDYEHWGKISAKILFPADSAAG